MESGTADATPDVIVDAGVDGKPSSDDCVGHPGVDFCSDFDTGLTPWTRVGDTSIGLKTAPSSNGDGQLLSIPIPIDSQPTTAFLYHDAPSTNAFRFGVDALIPKTPTGDYVSWFAIESRPLATAFSLVFRIDANTTLSAYESDTKVADLGPLPTSGMVHFEGTVAFESGATVITFSRDGASIPTMNRPPRAAPAGLRLSVGLLYAEASGGGEIKVDNVVYDTP